jgi:hypothetical protein
LLELQDALQHLQPVPTYSHQQLHHPMKTQQRPCNNQHRQLAVHIYALDSDTLLDVVALDHPLLVAAHADDETFALAVDFSFRY